MLSQRTDKEVLKGVVGDILLFLFDERQVSGWEYALANNSVGPRLDRLTNEQAHRLRAIVKGRIG